MKIIYLKNREIDRVQWDNCIETAWNSRIFAMSWYLDTVSEHWDALVFGNYDIVFPLTFVKKLGFNILYQPDCTQQLGVFSKEPLSENLLVLFLKSIPRKFLFGKLYLNSGIFFSKKQNFSIENRVNIELNVCFPIEQLRKQYARNNRRNLKKAIDNGVTVKTETDFKRIIFTLRDHRGEKRYKINNKSYDVACRICEVLQKRNMLTIYDAYNQNGDFVAGLMMVAFKNRSIALYSGCNDEGYEILAMFKLVDHAIEEAGKTKDILDFCGTNTESLARVYIGFGGKIVYYPAITIQNIPSFLIKSIEKARSFIKKQ